MSSTALSRDLNVAKSTDDVGGIVRYNFFIGTARRAETLAITINNSANIVGSGIRPSLSAVLYSNGIVYRFSETKGVEIRDNLMDAEVQQRGRATGTVSRELMQCSTELVC